MYNAYLARDAIAVTPTDGAELGPPIITGLWIGNAGNVTVVTELGTTTAFANVPAGTMLWIRTRQVKATGTTAANIVALY
ncbi:MAG: hypothetical protein KGL39_48340 [Patescibacteria group bacterium]|nr:hypothetical protein [Patescibacteria group bacterium]